MRKRDPIFWTATGIFAASLVLGATVHESGLLLMAFAYLLRPTLHAVGLARRYADERQLTNQYRSGNLAFFVVILGLIAVAAYHQLHDQPADVFMALLCIGIAAKALTHILLSRDLLPTGRTIVLAVASLMILFGLMEEGPSLAGLMHSVPGLVLAAIGLTGFRYPRLAGILTTVAAVIAIFWFRLYLLRQLPTFLLLAVPLFVAAGCLFFGARSSDDATSQAPS